MDASGQDLVGRILDHYRLDSLIGRGGMGAVYKAHNLNLDSDVAVKVMHSHLAFLPDFRGRFLQEARTAARLDHPGIVKVYDSGEVQGLLYIVMEFIQGANLRAMTEDLRKSQCWIPLDESIRIIQELCVAVDYVHRNGVLHRDIKPDNLMLKPKDGEDRFPFRPVLTDLGLAKLLTGQSFTQDGTTMGTPAYMSPEQALGLPTDVRSDVYSLGVLLYELAVGQLPFPIQTLTDAIRYHTKETPPPPRMFRPELPQSLEQVILKPLAKDPTERYSTALDLAEALKGTLNEATQVANTQLNRAQVVSLVTMYQSSIVAAAQGKPVPAARGFSSPPLVGVDCLQIWRQDRTGYSLPVKPQGMLIGRDPDCDVILDDPQVSRHHARLEFDGQHYRVIDLESRNGTFLERTRLKAGAAEIWQPGQVLQIGENWLRLKLAKEPTQPRPPAAPSVQPSSAGGIEALLEPVQIAVEPGEQAEIRLDLCSRERQVELCRIIVEGIPANWVAGLPGNVALRPGEVSRVRFLLQPPRLPQTRAGRHKLTVRVIGQRGNEWATVTATLTITPFTQFAGELSPTKLRPLQPAQVRVHNQGNLAEKYTISFVSAGDELVFRPAEIKLNVPSDGVEGAGFEANLRRRRWFGGERRYPFSARIHTSKGPGQVLAGELVSAGIIPAWFIAAFAVLFVLLCGVVGLILLIGSPPAWLLPGFGKFTETPAVTASSLSPLLPVPSFSPTPSLTATITPTHTQAPTYTPTLTPTTTITSTRPPKYPDLVIDSIWIDQPTITYKAEPWTWVHFRVTNIGEENVASGSILARVIVNDVPSSGYIYIEGPLAPGQSVEKKFAVGHDESWPPGNYTIQVEVDYLKQIDEGNDHNNLSDAVSFEVVEPVVLSDLVINSIWIDRTEIVYAKQPWTWIHYVVKNVGLAATPNVKVYLRVLVSGVPKSGYMTFDGPILPGASVEKQFAVGHDAGWPVGLYKVQVEVDYTGVVPEANEGNNISGTVEFKVIAP